MNYNDESTGFAKGCFSSLLIYLAIFLIVSLVLTLSGCATYEKTMYNNAGQPYSCNHQGFGLIGSLITSSRHDECVANANSKGFK